MDYLTSMRALMLQLGFTFTVFFSQYCCGQNAHTNTPTYNGPAEEVLNYFNNAIGGQSEVYNGVVYTLWPSATKGTFYFQDKNSLTPSTIKYNGTWYKNIPVLYDIYHDQMVSAADDRLFVLIPENLQEVYLNGHHFINIGPSSSAGLVQGYYDEMYDGPSQVLVKRAKAIEELVIPPQTPETWYVDKVQVFIKKGNNYTHISSRNALLRLFSDKRKELEQYLNDNKLDYTANPENTIARAALYYDQLNH